MKKQINQRWQSLLWITITVVLLLGATFVVRAQDDDDAPVAATGAGEDEALWKRLDTTEDGWLDGKELEGGWLKFDANGDKELTKAEFLAGRAKERGASHRSPTPEEAAKVFKRLDASGNGYLSGTELGEGSARTYDADKDNRVTLKEFVAGYTREKPATNTAPAKAADKPGTKPATEPASTPAVTQSAQTAKTNRFGAREPRTCDDTKAPLKGAITAALAQKYLNCQMEGVRGNYLYLVENVKVEVGNGIPYAAIMRHRSFSEIDVNHPVYPIRGSFLQYLGKDPVSDHVGPPDTNCTIYNHPKATGYCYKTTFGDWKCVMGDPAANNKENVRRDVAPPKR